MALKKGLWFSGWCNGHSNVIFVLNSPPRASRSNGGSSEGFTVLENGLTFFGNLKENHWVLLFLD